MTYVVTDNCIACKYTDCVEVCPVDCIPHHPEHVESPEDLMAKYKRLMAEKGQTSSPAQ